MKQIQYEKNTKQAGAELCQAQDQLGLNSSNALSSLFDLNC